MLHKFSGLILLGMLSMAQKDPIPTGSSRSTEVFLPVTSPPAQCQVRLQAPIRPQASGCWIDERVGNQDGVLTYPCQGGKAVATFGSGPYRGTVQNGHVELDMETKFPWPDHCDWRSHQHISGELKDAKLNFVYDEVPVAGTHCSNPCHAQAVIQVR